MKIIHIEILVKIAKISFSPMFCAFIDIRYQSDNCCFCIGQDVCVDCQVRRKEEKLKEKVKCSMDYVDLSVPCSTIPELYDVAPSNVSPSTTSSLSRMIHQDAFQQSVQRLWVSDVRYYSFAFFFLTIRHRISTKKNG